MTHRFEGERTLMRIFVGESRPEGAEEVERARRRTDGLEPGGSDDGE